MSFLLSSFSQEYPTPCQACLENVRIEGSAGSALCYAQYPAGSLEHFACLAANDVNNTQGILGCYNDPQCCDYLGSFPPPSCQLCVQEANGSQANCYSYCDMTTEPGTIQNDACITFCNAAHQSRALNCYELGLCNDQCSAPTRF